METPLANSNPGIGRPLSTLNHACHVNMPPLLFFSSGAVNEKSSRRSSHLKRMNMKLKDCD